MKQIATLLLLSVIALSLPAQEFMSPKLYDGRRHRGFFFSMGLGANQTTVKVDSKNYGFSSYKGPGVAMDLKIGGTLTENLILHATILTHGVTGPTINSDDWGYTNVKADNKVTLSEAMIGAGLTYYTPDNLFISSSVGFGGFTIANEREDIEVSTDSGFSIQLKAGKEWWVSSKWGIGVAAYYHHTNCINQEGNYAEEHIKSSNFGILFNATRNGRK